MPAVDAAAWMVDEWDVTAASNVEEVLEWARSLEADPFEVFVRWDDHVQNSAGEAVAQRRFTRVHGCPADADGVSESVTFTDR